jgi:hypothetical protein
VSSSGFMRADQQATDRRHDAPAVVDPLKRSRSISSSAALVVDVASAMRALSCSEPFRFGSP